MQQSELPRQGPPSPTQQIGFPGLKTIWQTPVQQVPGPPIVHGDDGGIQGTGGGVITCLVHGVVACFGTAVTLVMRPDMARLRRVIESGAWKRIANIRVFFGTGNEDAAKICRIPREEGGMREQGCPLHGR